LQYKQLFTSAGETNEEDVNYFLSALPYGVVNDQDRILFENEITAEDVYGAMRTFHKKKSSGSDWLTIEFYLTFAQDLSKVLSKVYNASFRVNQMPHSFYDGIVSQLYKETADKFLRSNWRPLTMLNVDYTLLAEVIAYSKSTMSFRLSYV
jgi:hypothetical protein